MVKFIFLLTHNLSSQTKININDLSYPIDNGMHEACTLTNFDFHRLTSEDGGTTSLLLEGSTARFLQEYQHLCHQHCVRQVAGLTLGLEVDDMLTSNKAVNHLEVKNNPSMMHFGHLNVLPRGPGTASASPSNHRGRSDVHPGNSGT